MTSCKFAVSLFAVLFIAPSVMGVALSPGGADAQTDEGPRFELASTVSFANVSSSAGLSGMTANFLAWGDYDNDSYQDLLVQGSNLFHNSGPPGWTFTGVSFAAGLSGSFQSGTWGDFNNDGWLDFYAAGTTDRLYKNDGDGTFTDVTAVAGNVNDPFPSTAAGWGDYNRDGYIDLYVCNGEYWNNGNPIYYPDVFWKNNGDGTFTNATLSANLSEGNHPYYGRGVNWADFNNDGWLDIYVSNYRLSPNYLYVNNGNGTFTELGKQLGCAGNYEPAKYYDSYTGQRYGPNYGHTIGSAWADFNNDGNLDLWTTNLAHKFVGLYGGQYDVRGYVCDDSKMYLGNGAPLYNFTDIRADCGIPTKPIGGQNVFQGDELFDGVAWADYDNDGDMDLWIPQVYDLDYAYSYLYEMDGHGNASSHWTDRASELGMRVYNTYAGVWCDYNNDGAVDLLTAGKAPFVGEGAGTYALHLYKNSGNSNTYLKLKLTGNDCNDGAIGARVKVTSGNLTQMREVEGGMGCHGSQNSMVLHFGFNDRTGTVGVEVRWPCGRIESFDGIGLNQTLSITESFAPVPVISSVVANPQDISEDREVNFTVSATVSGGTVARYEYDFTCDNTFELSSDTNTASYTYTENGTTHARVRVWTDQGMGAECGPAVITVRNVAPLANGGPDRTVGMDERVDFDAGASTDGPTDLAKGLSYRWEFGDGIFRNWSADRFANHSYNRSGEFNATLYVKDDDGATGTDIARVSVLNVAPTLSVMDARTVMEDETVSFTASANDTASDRTRLAFRWDFGDGNSTQWAALPDKTHSYTDRGNYSARFIVKDGEGAVVQSLVNITVINPVPSCTINTEYLNRSANEDAPVAFFGNGIDNPSDVPALQYCWDFGDGNVSGWSFEVLALHTYTTNGNFTVYFFVRDEDGDTNCTSTPMKVTNPPPQSEILTGEMTVNEDDTVEFDGKGTDTASDIAILRYRYDFGDGNLSRWSLEPAAQHAYPAAGTYKVTLEVSDDENASTLSGTLYVEVKNVVPTAVAGASLKQVLEDETIQFSAAASADTISDRPSLRFVWDFGDGEIAQECTVTHSYKASGTYTVHLSVRDNDDGYSTDETLRIKVRNTAPTVIASATNVSVRAGQNINFTATANDSPSDRNLLKFFWNFGDGYTDGGANVSHAFQKAGTYKVRVDVSDPENEKALGEITVTVTIAKTPSPPGPAQTNRAVLGAIVAVVIFTVAAGSFWFLRRKV